MAAVAASVASTGRQTGTALGVAIAGTIVGSAATQDGTAFTNAARGVWWLLLGLGVGIVVLGLLSTGRGAIDTANRAATLFEGVDLGADLSNRRRRPPKGAGPQCDAVAETTATPGPLPEAPPRDRRCQHRGDRVDDCLPAPGVSSP